jgi:TM2 domain-containing membrane protein YozV
MKTQDTTTQNPATVQVVINNPNAGVLKRNWIVALVLAITLGWLGIDRFYLGSGGVGIVKFFTLGLFGVLWVVDIILIAIKSVKGIDWSES